MDLVSAVEFLFEFFGYSSGYEFVAVWFAFAGVFIGLSAGWLSSCFFDLICTFRLRKRVKFLEEFLLNNSNDIKPK